MAERKLTITYMHDETRIHMLFSEKVSNNSMTIEQAEAMIVELRNMIVKLKEFQADPEAYKRTHAARQVKL